MRTTRVFVLFGLLLVGWGEIHRCSSASAEDQPRFKDKLYEQAIESFAADDDVGFSEKLHAFETAIAVGKADELDSLIERLGIRESELLLILARSDVQPKNLDWVFDRVQVKNLDWNNAPALATLAFQIGQRREAPSRLLHVTAEFLKLREARGKALADAGKGQDDRNFELDQQANQRRIEELLYCYRLGCLESGQELSPADCLEGIANVSLRDRLRGLWLIKFGAKRLTPRELAEAIQTIQSDSVATRVLAHLGPQLSNDDLDSEFGRQLTKRMLDSRCRPPREKAFWSESLLFELPEDVFSLRLQYVEQSPQAILDACVRSKLFPSRKAVLQYVAEMEDDPRRKKWINRSWAFGYLNWCVEEGMMDEALHFAQENSIAIETSTILKHCQEDGDFSPAKKMVDQLPNSKRLKCQLVLALQDAGKAEEAKPYLESLRIEFETGLAAVAPEKRPRWLVHYVMQTGWQSRAQRFPLEKEILEACKQLAADRRLPAEIEAAFASFTPPSDGAKRVLHKMMTGLPASRQVVTSYDFELLIERIRRLDPHDEANEKRGVLDAMRLLRGSRERARFAGELAFEFAMRGNEVAVKAMLQEVDAIEKRRWFMLTCARAFPPRDPAVKPRFSNPNLGGFF